MEGFEKIKRSWTITNTYGTPVKVTLLPGRKPGQEYRESCVLLPEDWEEFLACKDQQLQIFDITGGHPVLLKKGSVDELAEPTINLMARIFELPVEELHALWS